MTDVETVALREELARAMAAHDENRWQPLGEQIRSRTNTIYTIIARERAAALAAATPLIEARAATAIVAHLRAMPSYRVNRSAIAEIEQYHLKEQS